MNWISELYDLYEKNEQLVGKIEYKNYKVKNEEIQSPLILLPIFHTTVAAQITVTISENGEFLYADKVPDNDKLTIIPVTEKSGSRTAGIEAHPLCDNLKYLAGDYARFYKDKKGKDFSKNHRLYMEALEKWNDSVFSHDKVHAVFQYLQKNALIWDLLKAGVLKLNETGMLDDSEKIQNLSQSDAFVRFQIDELLQKDAAIFGEGAVFHCPQCWLDETLFQSFIQYYRSTLTNKDLCYLTGKEMPVSYLQPKKIRNEGDGAKLISSNDESNFTYRGRFHDKTEAFAIGYESSQKVHNALKWILRKQGCSWDGLYTVTWESDLNPLPEWNQDTYNICAQSQGLFGQFDDEDSQNGAKDNKEEYLGTGEVTAEKFKKALWGYRAHIENTSRVVLIAVDAATTGRLALTQFHSIETSRYLSCVEHWHESCEWTHSKYRNGERCEYLGMIGVKEMAEMLYGTEQKGMFSLNGKSRMYAQVCKRILPCIWNGRQIPDDMVRLAVHKASSPVSYEKKYNNWESILTLACSLVKRQFWDQRNIKNKEEWNMAVDIFCTDRNYLYGSLLAVADKIEFRTFEKDDKGRETNAKRYMCAFSQKPFQTWKVIEEKIQPYLMKLKAGEKKKYSDLLNLIFDKFTVKDFESNDSLNGLYLLGFHHQALELGYKPEASNTENIENDNNSEE